MDLRKLLKVPEGKLERWDHFHKRVIMPAVEEINCNPMGSGFTVTYLTIKKEKRVTGVKFLVAKTEKRLEFEQKLSKPLVSKTCPVYISPQFTTEVYEKAKKIAPRFDVYALEAEWREWSQLKNITIDNPEAAFLGFCKNRMSRQKQLPLIFKGS